MHVFLLFPLDYLIISPEYSQNVAHEFPVMFMLKRVKATGQWQLFPGAKVHETLS